MTDSEIEKFIKSNFNSLQKKVVKKIDQKVGVNNSLILNEESFSIAVATAIAESYVQGFIDACKIFGIENEEFQSFLNHLEIEDN